MYLIDRTYFIREINIPNTDEMDSTTLTELEMFIDEKVRLLLTNALGDELFSQLDSFMVNGVLPQPTLENPIPEKWINLVYGVKYPVNDSYAHWKGLIYTEGTFRGSLLAYFVYCHWLQYQTSMLSGVGEVKPHAKNAVNVNSTQRYVTTWNKFVEMYQGVYANNFPGIYYRGLIQVVDYFGYRDPRVSLLQFLQDNTNDYPDCNLMGYEYLNQLGL